ncbi:hypothetical protein V6N13_117301 [Hibiscus sabdariffa]
MRTVFAGDDRRAIKTREPPRIEFPETIRSFRNGRCAVACDASILHGVQCTLSVSFETMLWNRVMPIPRKFLSLKVLYCFGLTGIQLVIPVAPVPTVLRPEP